MELELNGLANMAMILKEALEDKNIHENVYARLMDQLDVLERYMCAVRKAYVDGKPSPEWFEVRDNRHLYPNNSGKVGNHVHSKPR